LGLRVVHPSSIVRQLLEKRRVTTKRTAAGKDFWESAEGERLFRSRLTDARPADLEGDAILLREIARGNLVMDSWTMPWLSEAGCKIRLKAPLAERSRRVAARAGVTLRRAREIVRMKDEETRKLNQRLYGFDLARDNEVFDLTIDTAGKSAARVLREALRGLARFSRRGPSTPPPKRARRTGAAGAG
jgi:cytidylate kinase